MANANLLTLGSGSALSSLQHFNSAHVLTFAEKCYMIDCGDGAQMRLKENGVNLSRLSDIFISHLHSDHCFGLLPLISNLQMLNRTAPLRVYAHADLKKLLKPQIQYFCRNLPFEVEFIAVNPRRTSLIFEDKSITVKTIPLKHVVPTCGFLFEEKAKPRKIKKEAIKDWSIPLAAIPDLLLGKDFVTEDGKIVPNKKLTIDTPLPKRFAYCSDTVFCKKIVPQLSKVDLLYHEATYMEEDALKAKKNNHSTTCQAAQIAKEAGVKKLIIGHFSSRYKTKEQFKQMLDEARKIFPETELAVDGKRFNF